MNRKRFADRIIDAMNLFKKGIKPEWEDRANRSGSALLNDKKWRGSQR